MNAQNKIALPAAEPESIERRVEQYDWDGLSADLSSYGCAVLGCLRRRSAQESPPSIRMRNVSAARSLWRAWLRTG
jgi:hypothetical protein